MESYVGILNYCGLLTLNMPGLDNVILHFSYLKLRVGDYMFKKNIVIKDTVPIKSYLKIYDYKNNLKWEYDLCGTVQIYTSDSWICFTSDKSDVGFIKENVGYYELIYEE